MRRKSTPPSGQLGGGGLSSGGGPIARPYYSTGTKPVAIEIHKRGRWLTVAKVVELDGEPVLAIAVRHQRGTTEAVSLPLSVVAYAEQRGCRFFYRRDDRAGTMGRIRLADMRRKGWIGKDGELYVRLADLEPVAWRFWDFAEQVVRLGEAELGLGLTQGQLDL